MAASRGDVENPPQTGGPSQPRLRRAQSAEFNEPSLDFTEPVTENARQAYLNSCVPLFNYASKGNWEKTKLILDRNINLLNAAIATGWTTMLHVAAGAGHVHFVKELLKMNEVRLDLQDHYGNTALSFAAISGNLEITKLLYDQNNLLPKMRSKSGFTPLLWAALQGKADVANYLFPLTTNDDNFDEAEWNKLFLTCIDSGIYDLVLKVLTYKQEIAFARDEDDRRTGLHIMAKKTDHGSGAKKSLALQLIRSMWKIILNDRSELEVREIINEPSRLLFDATKVGNFEFLAELMKTYPYLIRELDENCNTIIDTVVLHCHPKIFNLIYSYSGLKDIILANENRVDRNNILHLVAKLAPHDQLELVSGEAFQMQLELLWFEEVKSIVSPSYVNMQNSKGETPKQLFTKEHAILRKGAKSWMKKIAEFYMIVSTLITAGVFAAAFSIPGGINDDSGTPNYLWNPMFMVFAVSDAVALISSSTSILAFLSILISRYAERDFYMSLPSKLMFGLVTLFVSVTSMMIAFSSAFFVTYDHGSKWVPIFVSVLSVFLIAIFLCFQFQLFYGIIYSKSLLSSLFKPRKHMLH